MAEMPSRPQQIGIWIASSIVLRSAGASAIKVLWGAVCGMAISGCVFFIWTVGSGLEGGSGISGTRAVSFFGPEGGGLGAGATTAGAGATTAGAGGGTGSETGDGIGGETGCAGGCRITGAAVGSLATGFGRGDCSAGLRRGSLVEGGRIGS